MKGLVIVLSCAIAGMWTLIGWVVLLMHLMPSPSMPLALGCTLTGWILIIFATIGGASKLLDRFD